jgi:long-chain fatty acid transport protein
MKKLALVTVLMLGGSLPAGADQFHYHNVLMGDRAMGLGGAFTAIADDASGIIYNPAGLGFSLSNDISGSGNALYRKTVTYKKALGTSDFVENSGGTMAPFFGALQKLDHIIPGLVFSFGLFNRDSDLKDQNDFITTPTVSRFHRSVMVRAATTGFGAALAKRFGSLSFGTSLSYINVDELTQEYQDVLQAWGQTNAASPQIYHRLLNQNIRERLTANVIELGLGTQMAMRGGVVLGLSAKIPYLMSEGLQQDREVTSSFIRDEGGRNVLVNATEVDTSRMSEATKNLYGQVYRTIGSTDEKSPLGQWSTEVRAGMAWFASATYIFSADVIHHTATEGDLALYKKDAVTNWAVGSEIYVTPSFPLRLGMFSNYDSRAEPEANKVNQRDSIDYLGGSAFLAWVQPNSQIAAGAIMQRGTGKAQKLAGVATRQDIEALSSTFAVAATHAF